MPYKSKKQQRLMQAVAHNPKFAKKVGIPQSVGRKFEADKGKKRFAFGGSSDDDSWSYQDYDYNWGGITDKNSAMNAVNRALRSQYSRSDPDRHDVEVTSEQWQWALNEARRRQAQEAQRQQLIADMSRINPDLDLATIQTINDIERGLYTPEQEQQILANAYLFNATPYGGNYTYGGVNLTDPSQLDWRDPYAPPEKISMSDYDKAWQQWNPNPNLNFMSLENRYNRLYVPRYDAQARQYLNKYNEAVETSPPPAPPGSNAPLPSVPGVGTPNPVPTPGTPNQPPAGPQIDPMVQAKIDAMKERNARAQAQAQAAQPARNDIQDLRAALHASAPERYAGGGSAGLMPAKSMNVTRAPLGDAKRLQQLRADLVGGISKRRYQTGGHVKKGLPADYRQRLQAISARAKLG